MLHLQEAAPPNPQQAAIYHNTRTSTRILNPPQDSDSPSQAQSPLEIIKSTHPKWLRLIVCRCYRTEKVELLGCKDTAVKINASTFADVFLSR